MRAEWDTWVITLLGHGDLERGVSPVLRMVKEQGLELDLIEMPAGMGAGTAAGDGASYACARVRAYGRMEFEAQMRADLLELADEIAVDLVLQRESERGRRQRLFVFDMDSTLIQGEVIDELAKIGWSCRQSGGDYRFSDARGDRVSGEFSAASGVAGGVG